MKLSYDGIFYSLRVSGRDTADRFEACLQAERTDAHEVRWYRESEDVSECMNLLKKCFRKGETYAIYAISVNSGSDICQEWIRTERRSKAFRGFFYFGMEFEKRRRDAYDVVGFDEDFPEAPAAEAAAPSDELKFMAGSGLFIRDGEALCLLREAGDVFVIPEGIERIPDQAFSENPYLRRAGRVTFPSTLKSVGKMAFYQCRSLMIPPLSAGVRVGQEAFYGCPREVPDPAAEEAERGAHEERLKAEKEKKQRRSDARWRETKNRRWTEYQELVRSGRISREPDHGIFGTVFYFIPGWTTYDRDAPENSQDALGCQLMDLGAVLEHLDMCSMLYPASMSDSFTYYVLPDDEDRQRENAGTFEEMLRSMKKRPDRTGIIRESDLARAAADIRIKQGIPSYLFENGRRYYRAWFPEIAFDETPDIQILRGMKIFGYMRTNLFTINLFPADYDQRLIEEAAGVTCEEIDDLGQLPKGPYAIVIGSDLSGIESEELLDIYRKNLKRKNRAVFITDQAFSQTMYEAILREHPDAEKWIAGFAETVYRRRKKEKNEEIGKLEKLIKETPWVFSGYKADRSLFKYDYVYYLGKLLAEYGLTRPEDLKTCCEDYETSFIWRENLPESATEEEMETLYGYLAYRDHSEKYERYLEFVETHRGPGKPVWSEEEGTWSAPEPEDLPDDDLTLDFDL